MGSAFGIDTATFAPLADADVALWAIMAAFLWRFAGFSMVVYLAAIETIPREYGEYALLEGAGRFQRVRRVTWPLLWPQTFALVLLTTIGTLRIFDMVWIMTAGGPAHATETVATDVYVTAFRFLEVGYAQAMAMVLLARDPPARHRRVPDPQPARRGGRAHDRRLPRPMVHGEPQRARPCLVVPLGLDADERRQIERRHLPGSMGYAVAAGHREHR